MSRLIAWIVQLKRRKVVQVTGVYLVFAWGASLGLAELLPTFGAPAWAVRAAVVALFALTPVAAMLAWYFELTHEGVVRDPEDAQPMAETEIAQSRVANGVCVRWREAGQERVRFFAEDFVLGRDPACGVCAAHNPLASRQHAKVTRRVKGWVITDLDSRNGLFIDGERVSQQLLLATQAVSLGGGDSFEMKVMSVADGTRVGAAFEH